MQYSFAKQLCFSLPFLLQQSFICSKFKCCSSKPLFSGHIPESLAHFIKHISIFSILLHVAVDAVCGESTLCGTNEECVSTKCKCTSDSINTGSGECVLKGSSYQLARLCNSPFVTQLSYQQYGNANARSYCLTLFIPLTMVMYFQPTYSNKLNNVFDSK